MILDDLERLLDYARIGPRFSNTVLQTLLTCIKRPPTKKRAKLLVVATTSSIEVRSCRPRTVPHPLPVCSLDPRVQAQPSIPGSCWPSCTPHAHPPALLTEPRPLRLARPSRVFATYQPARLDGHLVHTRPPP